MDFEQATADHHDRRDRALGAARRFLRRVHRAARDRHKAASIDADLERLHIPARKLISIGMRSTATPLAATRRGSTAQLAITKQYAPRSRLQGSRWPSVSPSSLVEVHDLLRERARASLVQVDHLLVDGDRMMRVTSART